MYSNVQNLLLKGAHCQDYTDDFNTTINFFKDDFNANDLKVQLELFGTSVSDSIRQGGITGILNWSKSLSSLRASSSQVIVLIWLVLIMPVTNAFSERGFSSMRRIKSYLRSTMSQPRLNHLMLLSVHKEISDQLLLKDIANNFVSGVFGTF